MFQRKKQTAKNNRSRRASSALNESFRRNNVVISKSQREIAERQQSVTQRQLDLKRSSQRKRTRTKVIAVLLILLLGACLYRASIAAVALTTNASSKLSPDQRTVYQAAILQSYRQHTVASQAWLLDADGFNQDILSKYPEIEHVSVDTNVPFSTTMQADIRFRQPVFIWQDASKTDQFVDKNGILFSKNLDPATNTKKLIRIEDQSGVVLEAGSSVLTTQLVQFVGQLHSKVPPLYGAGNTIARVIIPKSTREVQIQVSNQKYLVKFSSTRNLDEQVGELGQLLQFFKEKNVTPSSYVDLRVPHKAFYK